MTSSKVDDAGLLGVLHATEERLRFLAETIPVQIWTALPDGRLDYVTQQTAYQLGTSSEQLLRDGWLHVVHADDAVRVLERWSKALASGEPYEVEFRLKLRDGAYAWHLGRAVARRDEAGNVVRWFGTNTNIEQQLAQQRQVEKLWTDVEVQAAELRETNEKSERFRREAERSRDRVVDVLESTQDAFFAMDHEFRITLVNRNQERVSGVSRDKSIGRNFFDVFPVERASKYWTEYHRVRDEKVSVHFEEYFAPLDMWTEVSATPTPEGGVAVFFRDITARKRSDSQAKAILESIADGLVSVDKRGAVSYANRHAETILDRGAEELLGKNLRQACPSLIGPDVDKVLALALTERRPGATSAYVAERSRWYDIQAYPAHDGGILVYLRDATDRRREAEALRESTGLLLGMSNSTGDVVFAKDREGKMRFANPAALALIGKSASEVLGRTDAEFLENEEAARVVMENDRRIMETGVAMDIEEIVPLPTGEPRVWLSRKTPNRDEEGRVIGVLGVSRDITELRRAFERISRLYEIAAAFSTAATSEDVRAVAVDLGISAVGASAGSLYLASADGESLEVAGMVGYPEKARGEWARFPLTAPVPIADAARTGEPVYLSSAAERAARYPAIAPLVAVKDTLSSACIPLTIGGRTLGALGLSFDRRAGEFSNEEHEFMTSFGRQCAIALERARLFDEQQLAREAAEHAGRMKDEFLTTLSHELRTPLNAILGWAMVLASRPSDETKMRHGLATIQRNAQAQTKIIDDLLDMSAIVSGKVRLDVQRTNLMEVLLASVEAIRPAADAKGVRLHTVLDPDAGPLFGDPSRLQQIFWNLLTNAMKFTPRGGRVEVILRRVDSQIEATVADTGDGIRPDFLPYVFDRFRQADASTTRRHGGLGLGLALVKQLVELHGGTVRVHSPGVGQGSSFTVTLPIAILHRDEPPDPERVDSPPQGLVSPALAEHVSLRGVRVLVVDDEVDARSLVEHVLRESGAVVRAASSAAETLQALETEWPDVLISDIGMPGEDGYALIAKVREREAEGRSRLPALALTAYARSEDRVKALRAGFDMHVVKPIQPAELLMVVASLARRGSS
jgi:PAS domain S-box-containing protein